MPTDNILAPMEPKPEVAHGLRLWDIAKDDFGRLHQHIAPIDLAGQTLLLTGATGFFGAWLLALLKHLEAGGAPGLRVLAVSRDPQAFLARHAWLGDAPWLQWIRGDIRDFNLRGQRVDALLHAATETSAAAAQAPAILLDSIVAGTRHALQCAAAGGARRILLVSSGGVYGAQPAEMESIREDTNIAPSTLSPRNAYGEGKRVLEMLGAIHAQQHGVDVSIARCFTFVGAGLPLDAHFAIGNFIRDALCRDGIAVAGDGRAVRSYLYAADLAVWLLRLLVEAQGVRAYNVGSDRGVSIAELAREVTRCLAPGHEVRIQGSSATSPVGNRYLPCIDRARDELGLDVWTELGLAIERTAAWARGVL